MDSLILYFHELPYVVRRLFTNLCLFLLTSMDSNRDNLNVMEKCNETFPVEVLCLVNTLSTGQTFVPPVHVKEATR